ncbi:MAG: TROVE domain-containing protein, partial [Bacteroidota bacterium]
RASAEYRLASLLLTNFLTDQYYRTAGESLRELKELVTSVAPGFAARAAVYARQEFGMRSSSHAVAALLAPRLSGNAEAKAFYAAVIRRPDDMLEITAAVRALHQTGLTNAMKKGFAAAFDRFDGYQLAKYRGEGKDVKLVDLVNLVHPVPTQRNAAALQALVNGTLRNVDTWEAKLSRAGTEATDQADKAARKATAWADLIRENKLGYFALLRNLRNLLEQAPELTNLICAQLTDGERLRKSKVLPFRLLTAYKMIAATHANARKVLSALETAADLACANLPELENTLVVVDNSGSMGSMVAGSQHVKCNETGALFGYALARRSNADLMEFGNSARLIRYGRRKSALDFAVHFGQQNKVGHGTNFRAIFAAAKRAYDRIVIFSDLQAWVGYYNPSEALAQYRRRTGADPFVYTVDLRGYGTLQFPERKVATLAGFSEKLFDTMRQCEEDPRALLKRIEAVEL